MTNYNWNYPTTVWVGKDRAKDLEKACVEIKTLKPLLVTDKDLINLEFIKDLVNDLEKKLKLSTFSPLFITTALFDVLKKYPFKLPL